MDLYFTSKNGRVHREQLEKINHTWPQNSACFTINHYQLTIINHSQPPLTTIHHDLSYTNNHFHYPYHCQYSKEV